MKNEDTNLAGASSESLNPTPSAWEKAIALIKVIPTTHYTYRGHDPMDAKRFRQLAIEHFETAAKLEEVRERKMTLTSNGMTISSWGWLDSEGRTSSRDGATFRLWSIRDDSSRLGFLAVPIDMQTKEVLDAAARAFGGADQQ